MKFPGTFFFFIFSLVLVGRHDKVHCQQLGLFNVFVRLLRILRLLCKLAFYNTNHQYVANANPGPALIDWREGETYTSVRNQNQYSTCGCCWAMAPIGALEILYSKERNRKTYLSVQQLIDCCPGTNGCVEGHSDKALKYLVDVGVTSEKTYPFIGAKGECRTDCKIIARAASFTKIANNEAAIVQALESSPLVVNLHCPREIPGYRAGVIANYYNDRTSCTHAAVIVGHGADYWIIRNSWGKRHGELGHYRLRKGTCGVGQDVWSITLDNSINPRNE